jgi:RND family efflux transporter MFP subunit
VTDAQTEAKHVKTEGVPAPDWRGRPAAHIPVWPPEPATRSKTPWLFRQFRVLMTLTAVAFAVPFAWKMWDVYMGAPWTRDATVRAYIVTMAPEVAGRVVELPVRDNQFVHKGDVLMVIDPTDYRIGVALAQAQVAQTRANADNAQAQSARREKLTNLSVSDEVKQTFRSTWLSADASHQQALANLEQARVKLERTRIVSPVNGYVTNLLTRLGDYANVGQNRISVIDADSFWADGYFEETNLAEIHEGDLATLELMGYSQTVRGHVDSIARGINVANAQPNQQGVATVNPIFTWVRLAQRIPVRIHIDQVPAGVVLSAGMTATVHIAPRQRLRRSS